MTIDANLLMPVALAFAGVKLLKLAYTSAVAVRQLGKPIMFSGVLIHAVCLLGGIGCIVALLAAAWLAPAWN